MPLPPSISRLVATRSIHVAALALLIPLAVLLDVHLAPRTITCEHRQADTICRCESGSWRAPKPRDVDVSEAESVYRLASSEPVRELLTGEPGIAGDSVDGRWITVCDGLPPHTHVKEVVTPIDVFLRTDAPSLTLHTGSRWLRAPLWLLVVLVVALSIRAVRAAGGSRAWLATAALFAIVAVGVILWPRPAPYADREGPLPVAPDAPREELFLRARGTRWHFEKGNALYVPAGERLVLAVAAKGHEALFATYPGPVRWFASSGLAVLEADTGVLRIPDTAPDGAEIDIRAEVGPARWPFDGRIRVYRLDQKPLTGRWKQVAEQPCSGDWASSDRIGALVFRLDGFFTVAAVPFETMVDYMGRYVFDPGSGQISLQDAHGHAFPDDFVGNGHALIVPASPGGGQFDSLNFEGIWLGKGREPPGPRACKMLFSRYSSRRFFAPR